MHAKSIHLLFPNHPPHRQPGKHKLLIDKYDHLIIIRIVDNLQRMPAEKPIALISVYLYAIDLLDSMDFLRRDMSVK